ERRDQSRPHPPAHWRPFRVRRHRGTTRPLDPRRRRRNRRHPRPQRAWQDHPAAHHLRAAAPARRGDDLRWNALDRPSPGRNCRTRRHPHPAGGPPVPRDDRPREPADGLLPRPRLGSPPSPTGGGLRLLPAPGGASEATGPHPLRRRTTDARHRPRPHGRGTAADDRRAVARPRPGHHRGAIPPHRRDQGVGSFDPVGGGERGARRGIGGPRLPPRKRARRAGGAAERAAGGRRAAAHLPRRRL
ncbi:MAG: Branched-chain amino acid transport ATP-binding protein LivF, partial [uncultured Thermomicrobiales bacterium]